MATDEKPPQRLETGFEHRLPAAADELERREEHVRPARELRDDLIYLAVIDGGLARQRVADLARVSRSHVNDVLGNPKVRARVLGEGA